MNARTSGILAISVAALFWSAGGLGIKVVHAHPLAIGGLRCLFALPVLAIVALIMRRRNGASGDAYWKRPRAWAAAASYAGTLVLFVVATRLTTAANAILLQFTAPVYVALASPWLLGEKLTRTDWFAVGGALVGVALCAGSDFGAGSFLGNAVALAAGLTYGAFTVLMRLERTSGSTVEISALGNVIGIAACLPWMISDGPTDATSWGIIAALGIVQIGLPYVLFAYAIARITAFEVMLFAMLEPVLNPVWVALGTGEMPGAGTLAGGLLIVASVTVRGLRAAGSPGLDRPAPLRR